MKPSSETNASRLYLSTISREKMVKGSFIYSGVCILEPRKKSPRSAPMKRAPFAVSDMTEFIINLVSRIDAAGEEVSP